MRERQSRASIRLQGQSQAQGQAQGQSQGRGQGQRTRAQGRRANQGRRLTPQQRRQREEERLRQSLAMLANNGQSGSNQPWSVGQREERLGRRPQPQRAPAREAGRLPPQPEEVARARACLFQMQSHPLIPGEAKPFESLVPQKFQCNNFNLDSMQCIVQCSPFQTFLSKVRNCSPFQKRSSEVRNFSATISRCVLGITFLHLPSTEALSEIDKSYLHHL